MAKTLNKWLDEFVENGADANDVTNWPENAGGGEEYTPGTGIKITGEDTKTISIDETVVAKTEDVGNGRITITQGGTTKGTFDLNQKTDETIELDAGGSDKYIYSGIELDSAIGHKRINISKLLQLMQSKEITTGCYWVELCYISNLKNNNSYSLLSYTDDGCGGTNVIFDGHSIVPAPDGGWTGNFGVDMSSENPRSFIESHGFNFHPSDIGNLFISTAPGGWTLLTLQEFLSIFNEQ